MNNPGVTAGKIFKNNMETNTIKKRDRKIILIIVILSIALLTTILIWKNIQINNLSKEAERKNELLHDQTKALLIESHKTYLKILAKPYVWAVRSELLTGNIKQVNLYFNEMVREKDVVGIVVSNESGVIISSTNKKNEGLKFSSIASSDYLKSDSTIVENINDSTLLMVSPIMGFNNRLGTLMITYRFKIPVFISIENEP